MDSLTTLTSDAIAAGFHALSEPLRLKVLELLREQTDRPGENVDLPLTSR